MGNKTENGELEISESAIQLSKAIRKSQVTLKININSSILMLSTALIRGTGNPRVQALFPESTTLQMVGKRRDEDQSELLAPNPNATA